MCVGVYGGDWAAETRLAGSPREERRLHSAGELRADYARDWAAAQGDCGEAGTDQGHGGGAGQKGGILPATAGTLRRAADCPTRTCLFSLHNFYVPSNSSLLLLQATAEELNSTKHNLSMTKSKLKQTRRQRDEKGQIVLHQSHTEQQLGTQARELLKVADVSTDHVRKLHSKLDRKRWNNFQSFVFLL